MSGTASLVGPAFPKRRIAILISGRGTNMASLITACRAPDFPAEAVMVVSNHRDAPGLALAQRTGVATHFVDHRPYRRDREAHEAAIARHLDDAGVEIVCLAGYMRLLSPFLVKKYRGRMINVHPSLLPAFPGLDTHARAIAAGVKLHGATVHMVTEKVDDGPILVQAAVPVLPGDDAAALSARVLKQEHVIYPLGLRLLADSLAGGAEQPSAVTPDAGAALLNPLPSPPRVP